MAKDTKKDNAMPATREEKERAVETAMANINKRYGKGSIMRLGDDPADAEVSVIPTGSLQLDQALGVGGVPRGRIVELYGPESSGKTTVALHIVAEAQKQGGVAAFVDVEHALDPVYARAIGVDTAELLFSQPDSGEEALEIVEVLARSGGTDVIIIDSVAALTPRAEIEGDMGDNHVGQLARLMSQAMRKLTAVISKSNCVAVFINQIREKIGVIYGNPETTPGGRALKFFASVRLEVRRAGTIEGENKEPIGNKTKIKVVKNKVSPPFKECMVDIIYGKGIDHMGEIVDMATQMGIIDKSGSWYSYGDRKLGQGRDKVEKLLEEEPALFRELEDKVKAELARQREEALAKQLENKANMPPEEDAAEAPEEALGTEEDAEEASEFDEFEPTL